MLTPYGRVLSRPGALAFSLAGLGARLPNSMVGLGLVLLVESATGSYGRAGLVAAVYVLAQAALAVPQGRWIDRWGQGPMLLGTGVVWSLGLLGVVAVVQADGPLGLAAAVAALSGAAFPAGGACIRARWSALLEEPADRETAFALESVVDEVVYLLGPLLITLLATTVHPAAGLVAAAVLGGVGAVALAAQRRTAPARHPRARGDRPVAAMPWRSVVPLAVVSLAFGTLFGAAEVSTVATAEDAGRTGAAGPLLALWALGSLVAGLVAGTVAWRHGPGTRLRWGSAAMLVAILAIGLAAATGSLIALGAAFVIAGSAIAPTMIAAFTAVEQRVPTPRLTEGMAFLQTGLGAGIAPGAALAGAVIDARDGASGFVVAVLGGLVALLASLTLPPDPARRPVAAPAATGPR